MELLDQVHTVILSAEIFSMTTIGHTGKFILMVEIVRENDGLRSFQTLRRSPFLETCERKYAGSIPIWYIPKTVRLF